MHVDVVYDCVLFHLSSGPICTSSFASVAINTIFSDYGGISVYLATSIRRGTCFSFVVITYCFFSSLFFGIYSRSLVFIIDIDFEL